MNNDRLLDDLFPYALSVIGGLLQAGSDSETLAVCAVIGAIDVGSVDATAGIPLGNLARRGKTVLQAHLEALADLE